VHSQKVRISLNQLVFLSYLACELGFSSGLKDEFRFSEGFGYPPTSQ
ncbi:4470_t:CDS:1, partial [Entrophospora sp. SA101]